jgi:hypothetical protein
MNPGARSLFIGGLVLAASSLPTTAQNPSTGSIEFTARVTPAAGRSEPVRELPFYLLSKSFQDIHTEADAAEPKLDLEAFIEKLEVSKELKAWMKREHSVALSGEDFTRRVKVDDIMKVPEFFNAYMERNAGDRSINFPQPKFRERDRTRDPAKYQKRVEEYHEAIRKFLETNPQSADGIEISLMPLDPRPQWERLQSQRLPAVRHRALHLAEANYLVARTETDLDGNGALRGMAPGNYWLSTLEIDATIGDVHLRWDTPVTVRAGEVTRVELSNVNAVEPHRPAP